MDGAKPLLREYLEALLIAVIFAAFARTFVVQAFKIPSGSMERNLLVGDHILVNKFLYGPAPTALERFLLPLREVERGDVVVFKFPRDPSRDFIKRCVGLPGDEVALVDKVLFLDGRRVDDESYILHTDPRVYPDSRFLGEQHRHRDNYGPETVPAESYFCLGDNRDHSNDSRAWGMVPRQGVKGRALVVYWSFAPRQEEEEEERRRLGGRLLDAVLGVRPERLFRLVR